MTATPLAERYGSPRRGGRVVLVVAGCLVVAFLGWLAWSAWSYASPQVTSELLGWRADGPHAVTARVDVHRSGSDVVASCTLRAYAEDHTTVGELDFTVPSRADPGTGPTTITLRTERAVTAVDLVGCTTPQQLRPR